MTPIRTHDGHVTGLEDIDEDKRLLQISLTPPDGVTVAAGGIDIHYSELGDVEIATLYDCEGYDLRDSTSQPEYEVAMKEVIVRFDPLGSARRWLYDSEHDAAVWWRENC